MSGGGGGKAIGYLIENAASNHGTLMVNSTPIEIRSCWVFSHNFRDLFSYPSVTMLRSLFRQFQYQVNG